MRPFVAAVAVNPAPEAAGRSATGAHARLPGANAAPPREAAPAGDLPPITKIRPWAPGAAAGANVPTGCGRSGSRTHARSAAAPLAAAAQPATPAATTRKKK